MDEEARSFLPRSALTRREFVITTLAAGLSDHIWTLFEWLTFPEVQRKFDESLAKKNRAVVAKLKEKEQPVVYVKVKRMAASRLEGLSLEVA